MDKFYIDKDALMDYCNNQPSKMIHINQLAAFPVSAIVHLEQAETEPSTQKESLWKQ